MAVTNDELARMVVTLEVTTTKYYNELRKAQRETNKAANGIEKRLTSMSTSIDRTFANLGRSMSSSLTGPLAGIGAAFSVREIIRYADTWTEAGNRVRAAGEIVGQQGRSLEGIRQIADDSRAGFNETVQLYSRILRSTGDVAQSELEVARATEIVTKAFKAGGAATSEMNAGILQLSQGLGSGFLQGDELRSVRENAPVLAKVIADYFGVTVAGLKELGAEGKLVSDEVFKAILSGQKLVESAFATTNRTIGDSFTLVNNALTQYIGTSDQSLGATVMLSGALTALADNFNVVADVAVKIASVIAGMLIGRGIGALAVSTGLAVKTLFDLSKALFTVGRTAATIGPALAAAFGPLSLIIGGATALALQHFITESANAQAAANSLVQEVNELGIGSSKTAKDIREAAAATKDLTEETKKLNEADRLRKVALAQQTEGQLRTGAGLDNLLVPFTNESELRSAWAVARKAWQYTLNDMASDADQFASKELVRLADGLTNATIPAAKVREELLQIQQTPVSQEIINLLDSLDAVAIKLEAVEKITVVNGGETTEVENLRLEVENLFRALVSAGSAAQLPKEAIDSIIDLYEGFQNNTIAADDATKSLDDLITRFPQLNNSGLVTTLQAWMNGFYAAADSADTYKDSLDGVIDAEQRRKDLDLFQRSDKASLQPFANTDSYFNDQEKSLESSRKERDVKKEIANIEREIAEAGGVIIGQEEKIAQLAARRVQQKEDDRKRTPKKSDADKFQEDLDKRMFELELDQKEIDLMNELNPLNKNYEEIIAAQLLELELLNDAKEAGLDTDEATILKIRQIVEATREQAIASREAKEANDELRESTREWFDLAKSAARSFIDDLIEGKTAAEALGNVLNQLGNKLIDMGLDAIFGGGSGGGFGLLGQLFGLEGRAGGGPVKAGTPYLVGEKRPELFVPQQNGVIIPKVPSNSNSIGGQQFSFAPVIDARGADSSAIARLEQIIQQQQAMFAANVIKVIQTAPKRNIKL